MSLGYIIRTKSPVNSKASITISEIQDKEQKNTKLHIRVSQNQSLSQAKYGFLMQLFHVNFC